MSDRLIEVELICLVLVLAVVIGMLYFPNKSRRRRPVAIALGLPTTTTKGGQPVAAVFNLSNDLVYAFPILVTDAAGNPVPPEAGDTFSAVSSDPNSLGVAVSGSTLTVTPLVQNNAGPLTVTITDQDGLTQDVQDFTIAPGAPQNIGLGTPTTTPQPIPSS